MEIYVFVAVAAAIAKTDRYSLELQAINTGEGKKCPHCAELIKSEAVKCCFCGSDVV